eukprot:Hpha_TRINITY_DN9071_c0_g1::TRINITY_DN9071_c0_g1_i2::g.141741::m.141741
MSTGSSTTGCGGNGDERWEVTPDGGSIHVLAPPECAGKVIRRPNPLPGPTLVHMNAEQWRAATESRGGCCPLWTMVEERLGRWPGYRSGVAIETRYKKARELGKGSFGTVFRGVDLETGARRAVKSLGRPSFKRTEDNMERWRRILTEVEVLSCLDHPNCISLVDVFGDVEKVHIVMDYTDNSTNLYEYAAHNSVCERDASEIAYHLLRALLYLHSQKHIVHRDIKPENILIARRVKATGSPKSNRKRVAKPDAAITTLTGAMSGSVAVLAAAALVSRCAFCKVLCVGPKPCCDKCGRVRRRQDMIEEKWTENERGEVRKLVERGDETHEHECNEFAVKLIDFGVARHLGQAEHDESGPTPVGSNLYVSLETINDALSSASSDSRYPPSLARRLLPRADIFSLGVVCYTLLLRVHPFRGNALDNPETMRGKMLRGLDFPTEAWGQPIENPLSPDGKDFLRKLLVLDPDQRPEAGEALTHRWVLARGSLTSTHPSHISSTSPALREACALREGK